MRAQYQKLLKELGGSEEEVEALLQRLVAKEILERIKEVWTSPKKWRHFLALLTVQAHTVFQILEDYSIPGRTESLLRL